MTLRERTLKLVEEKGVMKAFLADKLGIARQTFSAFLTGHGKLKPEIMHKLDQLIDSYYYLPIK